MDDEAIVKLFEDDVEADDARKALRKYTTYGKVKLTDKDWSVVGEGEGGNFNFFKVTVEMR